MERCQLFSFLVRKIKFDAMEEESSFMQQTIQRSNIFNDHSSSCASKLCLFSLGKLSSCVKDDAEVAHFQFFSNSLDQFEGGHVRQADIHNHAVDVHRRKHLERRPASHNCYRVHVSVANRFDDVPLSIQIVFYNQQIPLAPECERLQLQKRLHNLFVGNRF